MTGTISKHFRKIQSFASDYAVATFTQYESLRTGVRVVVVDRPSSKVQGDFCLATEIHDDSGAPHTLEHLVFMGSRSYQYKGLLDKLANRAYSSTNAWTDTDHTNYTLETAGWAGFAQILPIYLEHVILPTIKDSACYTEVHHIDGDGNDAGVVYSEMQALQNSSSEIIDSAAKHLMFPENIGYRYETGGMMEPLRILTNDKIRAFHKLMYQPRNLRICIVGQVNHDELLSVLDIFEDSIIDRVPEIDSEFRRPWVDSVQPPPLQNSSVTEVQFPEEDESIGEVYVSMFGPTCTNAVEGTSPEAICHYRADILVRALSIMIDYLSGSSAAVLQNILVEKEQLASSVDVFPQVRSQMVIWIVLSSVETSQLKAAESRLWEVMEQIASEPLDMRYLQDCARRLRKQIVYDAETDLGTFTTDLISDHLYCDRNGADLENALGSLKGYDEVQNWSENQWKAFLNKYFVSNKHISVIGVPSAELSEKLRAEEAARLEARRQELGPDGLEKLAKDLEQAKRDNEPTIPDHLFEALPVPSSDSIPWMETTTAQSGPKTLVPAPDNDIQRIIDADADGFPLSIHFEHMSAKCVYMSLVLFADRIPHDLQPLLNIFMNNFFATPLLRDGRRLEFEDLIKDLERDTISYAIDCGSFNHTECIRIRMVLEPEKYAVGVQWFSDLIHRRIFDADRLQTIVSKLLADIPSSKRDGHSMVAAMDKWLHLSQKSTKRAQGTLAQSLYLRRIKKLLQTEPDRVIADLQRLSDAIFQFSNTRVLVSADVTQLVGPVRSWRPLLDVLSGGESLAPVPEQLSFYSDKALHPGLAAYIAPLPTVDSSFAYFTTHTIQGYLHPRLPALLLALTYLDTTDGPLWNAVRGSGLAYGTNFIYTQSTGLLKLSIYRSPDAFKAYEAARAIVSDFVSGKLPIDKFTLEGAVSNIVLSFANEQTTIISAGLLGFVNPIILGIPRNYGKQLLREVRKVTTTEVLAAMRELIMPIFKVDSTNMVLTCAPNMAESLQENLRKSGFEVQVQPLDFFQERYGAEDDVDDITDDDGDDEGEDEDSENVEDEDEDEEELDITDTQSTGEDRK